VFYFRSSRTYFVLYKLLKTSIMKKTIITAMVALSGAVFAQVPTGGLINQWEFTNSLTDPTGGNNGTWIGSGAPTYTTDRCNSVNSAIYLNGTNYIQMASAGPIGSSARSLSFWMKSSEPSTTNPKAFFSYGRALTGCLADAFEINYDYGCKGVGPDICSRQWTWGNTCLYDGNWHHVVATYASGAGINQIKMYVDGAVITTTCGGSGTSILNTLNNVAIRIGCNAEPIPSRYFKGSLDDFYLYSTVLSPTDVTLLYNNQCTLTPCVSGTVFTSGGGGGGIDEPTKDCCLGNYCSSRVLNTLTDNYQIPMSRFNFNFTTKDFQPSKVLIGRVACANGSARLDVTDDNIGTGIKGYSSTRTTDNIGVHGLGFDAANGNNIATIGILGEANNLNPTNKSAGVAGFGGGPAFLTALPIGETIGVYGNSIANGANWAGYFDGDINVNGTGYAFNIWAFSDKRLKKDIEPLTKISDKIGRLKGYTYTFRKDEFKNKNLDDKKHIGFIAQELLEIFPELVTEKNGFLAVDYLGMVPVLLQGLKEQQQQINELKQQNVDLTKQVSLSAGINKLTAIETGFQMSQNEPNPFTHETVINYALPQTINTAFMAVYDLTGKQITTFPIREKGTASITITSQNLAAGIYIYSIVADGKVVDSKRMIVAEK
jgi:hypothetical protein